MFRKTSETVQLNAFTSPGSLFSGNALKFYEDTTAWHNLFRQQVTMRINESSFSPLFMGKLCPNSKIHKSNMSKNYLFCKIYALFFKIRAIFCI